MRTHETRSNQCVLVQPLPFSATAGAEISSRAGETMERATDAGVYGIRTRITQIDRAIIRSYFEEHCQPSTTCALKLRLPAQHARTAQTPGARLPLVLPAESLPAALEQKLSALPAGHQRVLVDDDVVLINRATRAIVDVMHRGRASDMTAQPAAAHDRNHAPRSIRRSSNAVRDSAARWRLCESVALF